MRSTSGYTSIWCIFFHQIKPRDSMAPITRGLPNGDAGYTWTQLKIFLADHIIFNKGHMKHANTRQRMTNDNNNNKRKQLWYLFFYMPEYCSMFVLLQKLKLAVTFVPEQSTKLTLFWGHAVNIGILSKTYISSLSAYADIVSANSSRFRENQDP